MRFLAVLSLFLLVIGAVVVLFLLFSWADEVDGQKKKAKERVVAESFNQINRRLDTIEQRPAAYLVYYLAPLFDRLAVLESRLGIESTTATYSFMISSISPWRFDIEDFVTEVWRSPVVADLTTRTLALPE